ncbi:MAG: nuclear transport factor 2 family protein [Cyanobacteria bacterium]|nr:nuclear transport factor 2 family protein [Cyanobacteriota bacterium]
MPSTLADAADAFFAAMNKMLSGDVAGIEAIWSEADDISHLGPMGAISMGRAAVMADFARESAMGFKGTLVADGRHFVETQEMGYLVCMSRTRGMSKEGQTIQKDIRATTVFRKEAGQWRVVHHQSDRF